MSITPEGEHAAPADSTEPISTEQSATDANYAVAPDPAPKKKRHWLRAVIILVIVLVLLVVGFFVADAFWLPMAWAMSGNMVEPVKP